MPAYPSAYGGGVIDFSPLNQIGESIGRGLSQRWKKQAIESAFEQARQPDGSYDYTKLTHELNRVGATEEANSISMLAARQDDMRHRRVMEKPEQQRLYEWAYPEGPQDSSAVTDSSVNTAQAKSPAEFMQSRNKALDPYTKQSEVERAKYNAYMARKQSQAPNIMAGLRNLKQVAEGIDDASFTNAVGPLQGADASDIVSGYALQLPRLGGEILNKLEGGTTPPTEVRNMVSGGAQALSAAIKPLVRAPGEGIWTDKDQELLDRIVGNLAESRTKAEYIRRLEGVANRVKTNFGLDISGWDTNDIASTPVPEGYAGNANVTERIEGGVVVREGEGAAPPQPSTEDKAKLISAFKRFGNDEAMKAAFDKKYGYPGLAEEILYELQAGR